MVDTYQIDSARLDGVSRVTLSGEVDLAVCDALRATLVGYVDTASDSVELDLAQLTFIDSSGLRALTYAAEYASLSGHDLRIVATSHTVRRTIELAGLDGILALPHA